MVAADVDPVQSFPQTYSEVNRMVEVVIAVGN